MSNKIYPSVLENIIDGTWLIRTKDGEFCQIESHRFERSTDGGRDTLMVDLRSTDGNCITRYTTEEYDPDTMRVASPRATKEAQALMDRALEIEVLEVEQQRKYYSDLLTQSIQQTTRELSRYKS